MKEEMIDNIMGIIIKNSEGITENLTDGSAGYAERVYLNLVKKELEELTF